ncbi:MAG: DNA repair protein RadC [Gemmatimonadetes bacterium]|nr:DNA repair protein RadC [Gemmatimonadota bacterium]
MAEPARYRIREWPRAERPRERLAALGAGALATGELLAILIGSGGSGRSAVDIAGDVMRRASGSLRRLATLPPSELETVPGVGEATAVKVLAALELGRRASAEPALSLDRVSSARDVFERFGPRLRDLQYEELHVLLLNVQHRILRDVLVTRGILDHSVIHAREVFRPAIVESAAGIILVHNHPSGDAEPSPDDRVVTSQLVEAGHLIGIEVLDHVIVGDGVFVSFAEAGLL